MFALLKWLIGPRCLAGMPGSSLAKIFIFHPILTNQVSNCRSCWDVFKITTFTRFICLAELGAGWVCANCAMGASFGLRAATLLSTWTGIWAKDGSCIVESSDASLSPLWSPVPELCPFEVTQCHQFPSPLMHTLRRAKRSVKSPARGRYNWALDAGNLPDTVEKLNSSFFIQFQQTRYQFFCLLEKFSKILHLRGCNLLLDLEPTESMPNVPSRPWAWLCQLHCLS